MEDAIADLYYIMEYARIVRAKLLAGEKPIVGYVNRMADLANSVQRRFDSNYEEWCDVQARRANGA